MDELDEFQEYEQSVARGRPKIVRRRMRDRLNPVEFYDEQQFFDRFRVNKDGFMAILRLTEEKLSASSKKTNSPLSALQQLALGLKFCASGDFQISSGDIMGIDQSTVSRQVPIFTNAVCSLAREVIAFPDDPKSTQEYFMEYCGLPSVSGVVDGTHISIQSPGGPNAELFRCRKGFFSFNVQVVCNEKLEIIDIVTGWPGSTHDSRVWNNSRLCLLFENGKKDGLLLGDSAYPLTPYMMIPYPHPPNSANRGRFNRALCKARCAIERTIGVWKRRFPCLSRGMRCKNTRVPDIITATAVLHNLCIRYNQPSPSIADDFADTANDTTPDMENAVEYRPGSEFHLKGDEVRDILAARFIST